MFVENVPWKSYGYCRKGLVSWPIVIRQQFLPQSILSSTTKITHWISQYARDVVSLKMIKVKFMPIKQMIIHPLTKILNTDAFVRHVKSLGLQRIWNTSCEVIFPSNEQCYIQSMSLISTHVFYPNCLVHSWLMF